MTIRIKTVHQPLLVNGYHASLSSLRSGSESRTGDMTQEYKDKQTSKSEIDEAPPVEPTPQPEAAALSNITDDILDEIDTVLESNAEEFVQAYVQKGGQ